MGEIQTSSAAHLWSTVSGYKEEGGAVRSLQRCTCPTPGSPVSCGSVADVCQKLDPVSVAHGPEGEAGDPPPFSFGPCHWPGDHGDIVKPP